MASSCYFWFYATFQQHFFEAVQNQQISEELRYKMLCYTLSVILLPAVGPSP